MTMGDGHDLKSDELAGDKVLEACYDNELLLRRGDNGPAIEKVQEALMILGFVSESGVNGIFGDDTEIAVRHYQESRGLKIDGVVGPVTIGNMDTEFTSGAPEPPVRPARASPVRLAGNVPEEERAPPVPEVEEPAEPSVKSAPGVEPVHAPRVERREAPPAPEAPEVTGEPPERITSPLDRTKPSPSNSPPRTQAAPGADSKGRRFHSSGVWNKDTTLEVRGGESMHFRVENIHALGVTMRIRADNGESREALILAKNTLDFEFSRETCEPCNWKFNIEVDSDTALLDWYLYSTWVPGDPEILEPEKH